MGVWPPKNSVLFAKTSCRRYPFAIVEAGARPGHLIPHAEPIAREAQHVFREDR